MQLTRQIAEQFLVTPVERLVDFDEQTFFLELGDRGPDDRLRGRRHFILKFGHWFERVQFNDVDPHFVDHHPLEVELHVDGAVMEPDVVIRLLGIDRDEVTPAVTERFPVKTVRRHDQATR